MIRLPGFLVLVIVLATTACTESVRRAALVPNMQPIQRSGQPIGDTAVELGVGSPTLVSTAEPKEAKDANAGIVLPRWEVNGALRARLTHNLDIGLIFDQGMKSGARKVNEDMPFPDNGNVYGYGCSLFYSREVGDKLDLGLGLDVAFYSIPYVEYRTCTGEDCILGDYTIVFEDRDMVGVMALGVIPSYRVSEKLTLFAGATVRNHPTIEKSDVENSLDPLFDPEDVEAGPLNLVVSGGAEVQLGGGFKAMAYIFQPVTRDPVVYGPSFGLALAIPLAGDRRSARQQPRPPQPDPYGPPPGYPAPPPPSPVPAPTY